MHLMSFMLCSYGFISVRSYSAVMFREDRSHMARSTTLPSRPSDMRLAETWKGEHHVATRHQAVHNARQR